MSALAVVSFPIDRESILDRNKREVFCTISLLALLGCLHVPAHINTVDEENFFRDRRGVAALGYVRRTEPRPEGYVTVELESAWPSYNFELRQVGGAWEYFEREGEYEQLPPDTSPEDKARMRLEHEQGGTAFCSRCCMVHTEPFDIECELHRLVLNLARDISERIDTAAMKAKQQGKRGRPRKYSSDAARMRANRINSLRINEHSPSIVQTWEIVTTDNKHFHPNRGEYLTDAPQGMGRPYSYGLTEIKEFDDGNANGKG
jgi:hypothetical protein